MVRMENVRALLCRDHVLLFEARRPRSLKDRDIVGAAPSVSETPEKAAERARELFAVYISQQAREPIERLVEAMPFHLRMLECLLDDTSIFFHQKTERLKVVVERMLEELTDDVNMGGLQRLLPLKRALTEVEHDVRDTHDAIEEVLRSDEMLEAVCLNKTEFQWSFGKYSDSERTRDSKQPTLRQAAADMLLTYQRQIDNAGGALEELRKNIDATQEIWELGLDTTRNRIIQIDVLFSLGTVSMGVAALVAGYFGMNIPNKLENSPTAFWWVVVGSMGTTFLLGAFLLYLVRIRPRVMDRRRARELAALRDLLKHLDDIDDIFQAVAREAVAGRAVTPNEFKRILHSHPTARFMRKGELDMMFRMFDTDRDGVLKDAEMEGKKTTN
ncbi:magnesium transporter MRS2-7 isoform X3 [Physcomitrium patens]|nr:magnesium transporter MRS2-7-like isoform X3 [Physcomitrium patens]|eukprot:XP_024372149.1 magnesium transporter MRS2-7-like isoform X3 [Physcomitrella patens]